MVDLAVIIVSILVLAIVFGGFDGAELATEQFSVTPTLPGVLPSVGDVVDTELVVNQGGYSVFENIADTVLEERGGVGGVVSGVIGLVIFITFLWSFLESGFLGCMKEGIQLGSRLTPRMYLDNGKKYFWDMLKYKLLVIAAVLLVLGFIALFLFVTVSQDPVAMFRLRNTYLLLLVLTIVLFLVAALLLLFTPYAIVQNGAKPITAIRYSYETVKNAIGSVLIHLLLLFVMMVVASVIVNVIATLSLFLAVFVYAPIGCYGIYVLYVLYLKHGPKTLEDLELSDEKAEVEEPA